MRAASAALAGATIVRSSFESVLQRAEPGDFVYCDPPYLPTSRTQSFTGYARDGFGLADHRQLRDVALQLKRRGVSVVISNSAAPQIVELYAEGFEIHLVQAPRSIAASGRAAAASRS